MLVYGLVTSVFTIVVYEGINHLVGWRRVKKDRLEALEKCRELLKKMLPKDGS